MKKLLSASIAATVMASAMAVAPAQAEVEASASISNMYLWRGQDLGNGSAMASADLTYSINGLYASTWIASGDSAAGNEYDLGLGYGGEVGDFSYDAGVWTYLYSNDKTQYFELSEFVGSVAYGPAFLGLTKNITGKLDGAASEEASGVMDTYLTLGASFGDITAFVGSAAYVGENQDYTHVQVEYAYSDQLTFGASQVIDADDDNFAHSDLKVFFNYSLPLK